MKTKQLKAFLFLLLVSVSSWAQDHNSVPLDHAAYKIIEMGIMRGVILPPPSAKPWSERTVIQKLREVLADTEEILTSREMDAVIRVLDSFDRKNGLDLKNGKFRSEGGNFSFEAGIGFGSHFSVGSFESSLSSISMAEVYAAGNLAHSASWNISATGEFLYIERHYDSAPAIFPYSFSKQWDGGVLSLRNPGTYGWPDDPSLAFALEGELNSVFFDRRLQLRLGRVRRDWGSDSNGASLFLNAQSRPFAALEGVASPLPWMDISFLGGALEHYRDDGTLPDKGPFSNMLAAAQVEFNPMMFVHFGIGGAAVLIEKPDAAFFADLKFRLPGLFTLWGRVFVDRLNSKMENFFLMDGNRYAYQAGLKTSLHWMPLATFTISYTKVEPYCYSSFFSGGESLGHYMPPNSDELLLRLESMLLADLSAHVQFQMMRHGADYGYMPVHGSSLRDQPGDAQSAKYFLMDGVYRWDNVIKLGGSFNFQAVNLPLLLYMEAGFALTSFTINGTAGPGNEAAHEPLNDSVYQARNNFIFSIGFRLFPR